VEAEFVARHAAVVVQGVVVAELVKKQVEVFLLLDVRKLLFTPPARFLQPGRGSVKASQNKGSFVLFPE